MTVNEARTSLSVAIITQNEERNITRCLESVKWADEVVVVDSGSTDKTIEIAKSYGAKTFDQPWLGFGPQKNQAINQCQSAWILVVDADEVVTETLKYSIQQAIRDNIADVYAFKRRSQFCGRWIDHGDWGRDKVTRLFRRGTARCSNDNIHERIISSETPQLIKGSLYHYTQTSIANALEKINTYTNLSAEALFNRNKKSGLLKANIRKQWIFFRSYILRCGWRDGAEGYLVAKLAAYNTYFKYVKLWEKHQGNSTLNQVERF